MKKGIRLIHFEFERLSKFLYSLIGILITSQALGTLIESRLYMNDVNELTRGMNYSVEQALMQVQGPYSLLTFYRTFWFFGPVALCVISLIFYAFFIWYREWLAKNTFAYRLLMLPMNRMSIFFSKLLTILLAILTLFVVQFLLTWVIHWMSSLLIATEFYQPTSFAQVAQSNLFFYIVYPTSFTQALLTYGMGISFLMVISAAILIERSYRLKGFILGCAYASLFSLLLLASLGINSWFPFTFEFYTSETLLIALGIGVLFAISSYLISRHLLKQKITV